MPDPNDHVDARWHLDESWRQWLHLTRMLRDTVTPAARRLLERRREKASDRMGVWIETVIAENHSRDT